MLYRSTISIALVFVAVATGFQQTEAPVETSTAAEVAKPDTVDEQKADLDNAGRQRVLQAMKDYVAPFPKRNSVFVPAKRAKVTRSIRSTEGTVQLRGVANVGEPRAILDIEGAIALVAVGREQYGVKVLSIEDKTVTLERGSNKWTASLE